MRYIYHLILFFSLISVAYGSVELGARPMGMGGAFTGLADDVNAIYSNPAGITAVRREAVTVAARLGSGSEYTMVGGIEKTPLGSYGIGYIDEKTSQAGTGRITSQSLYFSVAKDMNDYLRVPRTMGELTIGANIKMSNRKITSLNGILQDGGSKLDVNLATVFKPVAEIALGITSQSAGFSGKVLDGAVAWSVEGDGIGCEWKAAKDLAVRAGRSANGGLTAGLGYIYGGLVVDYAFAQETNAVHYLSISAAIEEPMRTANGANTAGLL